MYLIIRIVSIPSPRIVSVKEIAKEFCTIAKLATVKSKRIRVFRRIVRDSEFYQIIFDGNHIQFVIHMYEFAVLDKRAGKKIFLAEEHMIV